MELTKDQILGKLKDIIVPESNKPVSEFVKSIDFDDKNVSIEIELTKKASLLKNSLEKVAKNVLSDFAKAGYIFDIKITTEKIIYQPVNLKTDIINSYSNVKNIIAVASGKGGVGKSTIAANLAVALAKTGAKVGLLDADVYGPSVPTMFGIGSERPHVERIGEKDYIIPLEKYGVKLISIGFFVKEEDALIWRGSLATSAIKQLINDVKWGDLDYFVLDMPPGTGDVPLTMVQTIPITGAVIVTTPQQVAVADVIKAIGMFKANKIEVPILGIVENMAWFTPAESPDKKYYLFGKGGGQKLSEKFNISIIGQIPLVEKVGENSDSGSPSVIFDNTIEAKAMMDLAKNVISKVEERNKNIAPTKIVEITEG
jgi:ATP-binding protein involved in chromosome partitioning